MSNSEFAWLASVFIQIVEIQVILHTWICGSRQRDTHLSGYTFKFRNVSL